MPEKFEKVFTIYHYRDQTISEIANYNDQSPQFEYAWDDGQDDYSSDSMLNPISNNKFQLALEGRRIGMRWGAAFKEGIGRTPEGL